MSTANKLTYLNGTKQAIKQAINEDFEVIDNNTTFREYADEISSNNAKYKDLIPKETKNATNTLDISNSSGLDKALVTQYGNTYQETTTGKNLFNSTIQEGTYNDAVYTIDEDGKINQSYSDNSGWNSGQKRNFYLEAGTYTIRIIGKKSSQRLQLRNITDNVDIIQTTNDVATFTLNGVKLVALKTWDSVTTYPISYYIELEKGEITDPTYEKYSGGNPAPNPDYPQEIVNISGKSTLKDVVNNLFDIQNTWILAKTSSNNGIAYTLNEDDSITISGTSTDYSGKYGRNYNETRTFLTLKANQTYRLLVNVTNKNSSVGCAFYMGITSSNTLGVGNITGNGTYYTDYTPTTDTNLAQYSIIGATASGSTENGMKIKIALYNITGLSNAPTTYEPYKEQSFDLDLPFELCKIDTYKDRIYPLNGKWYLEKKIDKVVLDGSEDWLTASSIVSGTARFYYKNNNVYNSRNDNDRTPYVLSKQFIGIGWSSIYSTDTTTINAIANYCNSTVRDGRIVIRIDSTIASTVAAFKTWLSNNNVEVYYPLETPTTEEITESNYPTLYNQLNNIKLYEGVNHITMTNESGLDVEFDIEYYKDWKLD